MLRRRDGRTIADLRPLDVELSLLSACDGSARLSCGGTVVLASVHGPRPARAARQEDPERARLEVHVAPAVGLPGAPEAELCALLRQALTPALALALYPRAVVTLSVHVQADDGGAAAAAVNAAVLALADAGVALRGLLGAVSLAWGVPAAAGGGARCAGAALDPTAAEAAAATARGVAVFEALGAGAGGEGGGEEGAEMGEGGAEDDDDEEAAAEGATAAGSRVARAPLALLVEGPLPLAALGDALRGSARPAAAAVVAFLRRALREKVLRDAHHYGAVMSAPVGELARAVEA